MYGPPQVAPSPSPENGDGDGRGTIPPPVRRLHRDLTPNCVLTMGLSVHPSAVSIMISRPTVFGRCILARLDFCTHVHQV
jgi:hypothetical protein